MNKNRPDLRIKPEEIEIEFIRSSGPGGQNVNKVATAVQLRFDVLRSRSLNPDVKKRLLRLAGNRATASGVIIIEARRFRTQQRNRIDAMERLNQLVARAIIPPRKRRKTAPSAGSVQKRLQDKKRLSDLKRRRRKSFSGDE